jgi:hypothetical protein
VTAIVEKIPILWGLESQVHWTVMESRLKTWERIIGFMTDTIYKILLALAAVGAIGYGRGMFVEGLRWNAVFFLTLVALALTITHMFLEVQPKYHFYMVPLLSIFAGLSLRQLFVLRMESAPDLAILHE